MSSYRAPDNLAHILAHILAEISVPKLTTGSRSGLEMDSIEG